MSKISQDWRVPAVGLVAVTRASEFRDIITHGDALASTEFVIGHDSGGGGLVSRTSPQNSEPRRRKVGADRGVTAEKAVFARQPPLEIFAQPRLPSARAVLGAARAVLPADPRVRSPLRPEPIVSRRLGVHGRRRCAHKRTRVPSSLREPQMCDACPAHADRNGVTR